LCLRGLGLVRIGGAAEEAMEEARAAITSARTAVR
jgi:hypothetical protein